MIATGEPQNPTRGKGAERERAPPMLRLHLLNREEEMTQHDPSTTVCTCLLTSVCLSVLLNVCVSERLAE